jgi:high affinity Mn2+ porin
MVLLSGVQCAMFSRKQETVAKGQWSKWFLCGAAILVSAPELALAADPPLVTKAPVARALPFDWNGAYVGGHVGITRGRVENTLTESRPIGSSETFGPAYGGVQGGYNLLLNSGLLLGVEADITFSNHLLSNQVIATRESSSTTITETVDYVGTVRGRIGYAFDRFMVYGTGGFAYSQARIIESPGSLGPDDDKRLMLRAGWAAGGGAELALNQYWSARLEYLYHNFGPVSLTMPSGRNYESTFDMHMLRVGLNRKLGGPDVFGPKVSDDKWPGIGDWNVHGQVTVIGQGHGTFRSPYQGENSMSPVAQFRNTSTMTAFIGVRPWEGGEIYLNPELMQGFGLSDVRGVAAFPNGEAQKSNFPTPRFNMARMYLRQTWGLGGEQETIPDGPNQLATKQDIDRVTVTAGKFSVLDFFNLNAYSGEPRTGFLNWQSYGGGSYDWTMDRLSWTWGAMAEINRKDWAFRTGYFLLPTVSNVDNFDMKIPEHGEYVAELELRYALLTQPGKLRLFGWLNHGTMGSYSQAVALPLTSPDYPDITATRKTRTNYGVVVNLEQAVTDDFGIFSRVTWSPGHTELVGWTDAHRTASLGGQLKGTAWGRPNDKVGLVGIVEELSSDAQAYFAAGGMGILIGDGALNYRREKVLEAYYAFAINNWSALTFDYQFVANPAYNADRGPISFYSVRYHAEW